MPPLDAKLILAVLGPVFLLLGISRCLQAKAIVGQGRTWLLVGVIFSVVAAWLWFGVRAA